MSRKLTVVLRSILGLIFVVAPLGTALHLFPEPALPPGAADFAAALIRLLRSRIRARVFLALGSSQGLSSQ